MILTVRFHGTIGTQHHAHMLNVTRVMTMVAIRSRGWHALLSATAIEVKSGVLPELFFSRFIDVSLAKESNVGNDVQLIFFP